MTKTWIAAGTALITAGAGLALAIGPAPAQDKTVKIGFISTFSGPPAAIGNDMKNSFELGLDHHGRKLGGLPVVTAPGTTTGPVVVLTRAATSLLAIGVPMPVTSS